MRPWLLALLLLGAPVARADHRASGAITGRVAVRAGDQPRDDRSSVVVYLDPAPPGPRRAPRRHEMWQRDKAFAPRLLVVQKGDIVEFPNGDHIFHNVFSLSKGQSFDLGLHKTGTRPSSTFDRAGTVDVFCNIHPQMSASIKVLDTGYFAVTDRAGDFRIPAVPPGTYALVAWTPQGKEVRHPVTVAPGKTLEVSLELVETRRVRDHVRKDGTPYPRY